MTETPNTPEGEQPWQPPSGYQPPPGGFQPPPGGYQPPPGQYPPPAQPSFNPLPPPPGQQPPGGFPAAPPPGQGYGYGAAPVPVPSGLNFDPATGLALPPGVTLAPVGRRIGAFFLSIVLFIVTLGIGFIIWGLVLWGRGTSPAFSVLKMKVWKPDQNQSATFGTMALRNIVGGIVQGFIGFITGLVSFIMFVATDQHKGLPDTVASTIVVYDPNGVLG